MTIEQQLEAFVRESNRIEGILRDPTPAEIEATDWLLGSHLSLSDVLAVQEVYAPGKPLRTRRGMNVRVGNHVAPPGGPEIEVMLRAILASVREPESIHPLKAHMQFETLHPFMDGNGRTGRAVWAWHMIARGDNPFSLPFLHRWYYQTLTESR